MRCVSAARLMTTFNLTAEEAEHIRNLAKFADAMCTDRDKLEAYINDYCPATAAYARSCHGDPYRSQIWRVTMALHAIDVIVSGCGVEGLGPGRSGDYAPPYEYVNMGDPYGTTLIYSRDTDNLYLGCWGTIAERHSNW